MTTSTPKLEGPFFTSDTHFFHKNIIKYCQRPFLSMEEMNRVMIERWNATVPPDGLIYHLGDFAFGIQFTKQWVREALTALVAKLHGRKILIRGNHDRGEEYMKSIGFHEVYDGMVVKHLEIPRLYLHHQPEMDWAEKLGKDCEYHLCGHVHELWDRRGKIINVGVDQSDFRPLTLPQLLARKSSHDATRPGQIP